MTSQPTTPRATAGELALAFVTVARVLDSHGIAPWSAWTSQDTGQHDGPRLEVYVARDELTRLVPDVDGARLTLNGEFMHLNGRVEGVAVEFYADAEDADRIEASLERTNVREMRRTRTVATS